MKKVLKMALASSLATLLLVGCSTQSNLESKAPAQPAGDSGSGKVTIGLSISTQNNPFFVTLKEGAEKAAKEAGAELIVVDAQDDTAKQISGVEDLIQKKVSVILINPTDSAAIATAVESANKANIPVITVDRAAEGGGKVVSHIASDNVKGGKMAGEYVLQTIGGKGNIVELQGIAGTSAARDRGKGFHEAVDGKDGVKVVASQPADFDRAKGMSVMENILQGNPDIQAVFAHNDEMALGALQAIEASGKKIAVVGFDATDDAVKAVNDGKMAATVAQKPAAIGETAVQTAMKVTKGEQVESFIPVDLELVTKK